MTLVVLIWWRYRRRGNNSYLALGVVSSCVKSVLITLDKGSREMRSAPKGNTRFEKAKKCMEFKKARRTLIEDTQYLYQTF